MACVRCKSARVLDIGGKCSDMCSWKIGAGREREGYAPRIPDICGGDYIEISVCLDCGQAQGSFPVPSLEVEEGRA